MSKLLCISINILLGLIASSLFLLNVMKNGITAVKIPLYCSIGFLLSQLFHFYIFNSQKWNSITGFLQYNLPLHYAFKASFTILFISFIVLILSVKRFSPYPVIFLFLIIIPLILSQIFGRSLIKFGFEASFCLVVFLSLVLEKHYGAIIGKTISPADVKFLYRELWEVLKISITISIFWLGTVGVAFAVQFLNKYFKDNPLMTQPQMFRYGVMFIYSVLGIGIMFYYPLFSKIAYLRSLLLKH